MSGILDKKHDDFRYDTRNRDKLGWNFVGEDTTHYYIAGYDMPRSSYEKITIVSFEK